MVTHNFPPKWFPSQPKLCDVNYIIVDQKTKYCDDWAEIDETVRSCFMQKYFH